MQHIHLPLSLKGTCRQMLRDAALLILLLCLNTPSRGESEDTNQASSENNTVTSSQINNPGKKPSDRYEANFRLVEMLLTKSSIAKAVSVDNKGGGSEQQHDARFFFNKAKEAHKAGDKKAAEEYLEKAKKAMLSAGKNVGAKKSHEEKLRKDFTKRINSTESILDALKRVNLEKKKGDDGKKLETQIELQIKEAKDTYKNDNLELANDQAYASFLLAKQSMINLRDGDTLVRSLNFKNKEEEYHYELDRNNTHNMLVNLLLKEKLKQPNTKKRVDQKMAQARELREKAESLAKSGKFSDAVKTLEESTKYIIHAIRAGGIFIPG